MIGESAKLYTLKTDELEAEIAQLKSETQQLEDQLSATLRPVDLARVLPSNIPKQKMLDFIEDLAKRTAELDKLEQSPVFVFSKLERVIDEYESSINTRIENAGRKDAYRLIKLILQAINAFHLDPDGNQAATYQALLEFQQKDNSHVSEQQRFKELRFF